MNQVDELRGMVATMLMLPPDQVGPETSLASLDNSLGGAKLKLGLKRLGLSSPVASSPATFGELEAALFGKLQAKDSPAPKSGEVDPTIVSAQPVLTGLQVGIDVQDVRSLPVADDYWEHEFYVGMFGKSEIAYAVVKSEPRTHLAAYWCAKEALRKCDPSFIKVGFETTVVAHEPDGRPYMQWQSPSGPVRLPHALSLSHTGELATAIVIAVAFPQEAKPTTERTSVPPPANPKPTESPDLGEPSRRPRIVFASGALLVVGAIFILLVRHFLRS
jgi:phosphopantetheinyl transferase (holo-ACP synthase)